MVYNMTISEGMLILDQAFSKTKKVLEGSTDVKFTAEEYQRYYECVYLLCIQKASTENARTLYARYKDGLKESINSLVIPSLEDKSGEELLNELLLMWSRYQVMATKLSRFFEYLNRFYIPRIGGLTLSDMAVKSFHELIKQDLKGMNIDRSLIKNAVAYFDLGRSIGETCYQEFQTALYADAAAYYSQIASNGLVYDTCDNYVLKVECHLREDGEKAGLYLDQPTKSKLLEVAKYHLLDQVFSQLTAKKQVELYNDSADYQDLLSKCVGLNLGKLG